MSVVQAQVSKMGALDQRNPAALVSLTKTHACSSGLALDSTYPCPTPALVALATRVQSRAFRGENPTRL